MNIRYLKAGIGLIIIGILIIIYLQFDHIIFDQTHKIDQEAEHSMAGVSTIKIRNTQSDITIYTADYDDFYASFSGTLKSPTKKDVPLLKAFQDGDVLTIEIDHKAINVTSMESMSFDIFIPTNYHGTIDILTNSSNISLPAMRLDELICVTQSGDIVTQSLDLSTLLLSTISGDVDVTLLMEPSELVTTDSVTGSIENAFIESKDSTYRVLTTSGDIIVKSK